MTEFDISDSPSCVARWASDGRGHARGQICGRPAIQDVEGTQLCGHHFGRLWDAVLHEEWVKIERRRFRTGLDYGGDEWAPAAAEVIYYARRSDGLIKIGWTRGLLSRLSHLRAEHGPLQLLLSHRGNLEREREMHAKFARFRADGEFFHPRAVLMAWILKIRRAQDPDSVVRGTLPLADVEALAYRRKRGNETVTATRTVPNGGFRRSAD